MQRSGFATLRLHYGSAPPWLYNRMVSLGKNIMEVLVDNYGQRGVLERISNTFFFQSLSNVLGFDWNSSGTTTVLCGVLQQVFRERELGLRVVGGKGSKSRQTQGDLASLGSELPIGEDRIRELRYSSRITAKVDSTAIQAGYQLYHHCMFVSGDGEWTVVQQGMNPGNRMARRYHWLGSSITDYVEEPHEAIVCDVRHDRVLDLTSSGSGECRKAMLDVAREGSGRALRLFESAKAIGPKTLLDCGGCQGYSVPRRMDWSAVERAYQLQPENFEGLLAVEGLGPATVRGLALIAELVYGSEPSWKDPVKYSFAFGGKDGVPFPVDRRSYDEAIVTLEDAVKKSNAVGRVKAEALRRLGGSSACMLACL